MDSNILLQCLPLFYESFTGKEIGNLAEQLFRGNLLLEDVVKSIKRRSNKTEKITCLIESGLWHEATWFASFQTTVRIVFGKEKEELLSILIAIQKQNNNIIFLLESVGDLVNEEKEVRNLLWMITTEKLRKSKWLLQFFYLVVTCDHDQCSKLVNMLNDKLAQSSLASGMSENTSMLHSSSSSHEKDVTTCLVPLIPLMSDCINESQFKLTIAHLKSKGHLSGSQWKNLKGKTATKNEERIAKMVNSLKFNAKDYWKRDLIDTLQKNCSDKLFCVVQAYMFEELGEKEMTFLVKNWTLYKTQKEVFKGAVKASVHKTLESTFPDCILEGIMILSKSVAVATKFKSHFKLLLENKTYGIPSSDKNPESHKPIDRTSLSAPLPKTDSDDDQPSMTFSASSFGDEISDQTEGNPHRGDFHDSLTPETNVAIKKEIVERIPMELSKAESSSFSGRSSRKRSSDYEATDKRENVERQTDNETVIKNEPMEVDSHSQLQHYGVLSYADAVSSESGSTGQGYSNTEQHHSLQQRSLKISGFDHYFTADTLKQKNKYALEFQAVVVDQLQENDELYVYLHHEESYMPMHFNPLRNVYSLVVEVDKTNHLYKYLVFRNSEEIWEFLPVKYEYGQIRNRNIIFQKDGLQQRHMITFDVITLIDVNQNLYQNIYSAHVPRLWSSFNVISVQDEQKGWPLHVFVKMYSDWFASTQSGVAVITQSTYRHEVVSCHFQVDTLTNHLASQINMLADEKDKLYKAKRVLGTLGLIIAMKLNGVSFDKPQLKLNICNGLTLHDVDDEQRNEIFVQLTNCYGVIENGNREFKSKVKEVLDDVFVDLSKEPECLLFLPVYTIVMNAASGEKVSSGIKIPSTIKLGALKQHLRQNIYQRSLKEIAEKITLAAPVFPKIREIYQDVLSPQTVCDLISIDKACSQLFDIKGIFQKFVFFWKQMISKKQSSVEEITTVHCNLILKKLETLSDTSSSEDEAVKIITELLKTAEKLLNLVSKSELHLVSALCIGRAFDLISRLVDYALNVKVSEKVVTDVKSKTLDALTELINKHQRLHPTSGDIEIWNILTEVEWNESFSPFWKDTAKEALIVSIPKRFSNNAQKMLEFYAEDLDIWRPNEFVRACFVEVIIQQVENSLQANTGIFEPIIKRLFGKPQVVKVCVDIFLKYWNKTQMYSRACVNVALNFMLKWPPAAAFFKLLYSMDLKTHISRDCKKAIQTVKESIEDLLMCLQSGKISLAVLKQISEVETQYLKCYECVEERQKLSKDTSVDPLLSVKQVKDLIKHRLNELRCFHDTQNDVDKFLTAMRQVFQRNIFTDTAVLAEQLELDTSKLLLSEVLDCKKIGIRDRLPFYQIRVILFPLTFDVLNEITHMQESKALSNHHVQNKLIQTWKKAFVQADVEDAADADAHLVSISDFLLYVWTPVRKDLFDVLQRIDDGTIFITEVNDLFGDVKGKESIQSSLNTLHTLYRHAQEKMDLPRLNNYGQSVYLVHICFLLRQNKKQAQQINDLRNHLKLEGAFNNLEKSMDAIQQFHEKRLSFMTQGVISSIKDLESVAKHDEVISACVKNANLIEWLKENMKNINEVKVMSDLAMISAGETPMDVDRVSCFLSAVMGFAPLIFDLPKTAGWGEFIKACREVGDNAHRDKKLLKNWESTAKELEWLKTTKDLHGSVEKSSLKRAQLINLCGNYVVGGEHRKVPDVVDCLRMKISRHQARAAQLTIPEDIEMGLSELRDLQSRLMLIAGEAEKGKHDVNRFIAVLSVVEKLTKAYVKLRSSGCLLFSNWRAIIRCNDSDGNVTLSMFFDEKSPAITSKEKVIPEVHKLTTVLEDANKQWLAYLSDKRSSHYHLNNFNIHQLTYLCKNLANADDLDDFPDQVYCLLASVLPSATYEDIIDTLDDATRIKDDVQMEEHDAEEEVEPASVLERKAKIVRQLVQGELSENVAKAAVQAVKTLDLDDCYLWALENEYDEPRVAKLHKEFDNEMGFKENWSKIGVVKDVLKDHTDLTLKEVIEHIQENLEFDEKSDIGMFVNTICERYLQGTSVTSLSDCVSLEHLGIFLSQLSTMHRGRALPRREWADQFECGKPNLIVCTPDNVWQNVLSIFAKSPDQPLPSATEVLICSQTTTSEDVELLLRRAIGVNTDDGKRIYCLACADQLSFTVAREVEQVFQNLTQKPDKENFYRLVVVSSNSQHYMTTCFDEVELHEETNYMKAFDDFPSVSVVKTGFQHQVAKGYLVEENDLKSYVKQHLKVSQDKEESVAIADNERSSVRLVYSESAGNGKSLFIARCRETVQEAFEDQVFWHNTVLRFLDKTIDIHDITESLYEGSAGNTEPHFIHIDITPSVGNDANKFLFDLLFLGSIQNSHGVMWRRSPNHFYAIEYTQPQMKDVPNFMQLLDLIPSVTCLTPRAVVAALNGALVDDGSQLVLMDGGKFQSEIYQRPYQYLHRYRNGEVLDGFTYSGPSGTQLECLNTLLQFCSIAEPSWAELHHFSSFLNVQLRDCENSIFCNVELVGVDSQLIGFKGFVVRFMIRMSQDFATSSLGGTDRTQPGVEGGGLYELHQLRRKWESRLHPYLFFNDDSGSGFRTTMSFVHFNILRTENKEDCNLCHPITNEVVEERIMSDLLYQGLHIQGVSLQQNFDELSRAEKLTTLCNVFGMSIVFDPDPTYELTTDNVLKMLAIHMRFRCDIPVVIMGETGCGKTRMVEFMSKLKAGPGNQIRNMLTVKVHGGITVNMIQQRVREAAELARENGNVETVLFLDEANTTEAIYAIKEVVCDKTVHGTPFHDSGLKIVAACNPYRKHTDEEIQSMENCGLGFNVKTSNTQDKFAGIPMRHLVYRVIPLPPSMQPMVWDFGQLNNDTEEIYINQMVLKLNSDLARAKRIDEEVLTLMTRTLAASQRYMRNTRNVCRFVSLRDVERSIKCFMWFYERIEVLNPLIEKAKNTRKVIYIGSALRAFVQALGMCYHTTLSERKDYRVQVAKLFAGHIRINEEDIRQEIVACQSVFMNSIEVEKDIACNEALRENVFMMIICAEMRIPLFLVGKPGSSKSLAKTTVTKAMQGKNSTHPLFRDLKQIHVSSFQCSAVSDAVGIETVFNQCAQIQSNQDLKKFVAVVVLDEIGLAEDSPKMPLKVLHPLLEVGSTKHTGFDVPEYNKVGFVGISNWALDPAKMNRGIFVTRGEPTKTDLKKTAEAFFKSDKDKYSQYAGIVKGITDAYLEVCHQQAEEKEFFGLRDYYGLLKMLFKLSSEENEDLYRKLAICVLRNFGGYHTDVFHIFKKTLDKSFSHTYRPDVRVVDLVQQNLNSDYESRFLLLLTKQYSAVSLLGKVIDRDFQVIFGSSFPRDHDYTEICRNINRIKVCMESGKTVVLLNLRDLYESLYDALNQQYVTFSYQRYVDLGLGGHRVKCRIADNFRLIVIEEKEVVYKEFPIPLINRLEKQVFEIGSVLNEEQESAAERLNDWAKSFANVQHQFHRFSVSDAFVGFQEDTAASIALTVSGRSDENVLKEAKSVLLQTASLDSVVRLSKSKLDEIDEVQQLYTVGQSHETLERMLAVELQYDMERTSCVKVFEIVSFSMCLNEQDRGRLETKLELTKNRIMLITLQQLQTEEEYIGILDEFFAFAGSEERSNQEPVILLIQCPQAQLHSNLIACAKYSAMNKVKEFKRQECRAQVIVAFLFSLERSTTVKSLSFTTYHSSECDSVYVDQLRPGKAHIAQVSVLWDLSVSETLETGLQTCFNPEQVSALPVDILCLLRVSIPDAMACLTNQHEKELSRNRVKILNRLCFDWKWSKEFVKALLQLVVGLMRDREKAINESWIVKEACSRTALQNGGSFRNTLWLRLKQLIGIALARIISVADCDKNLDILLNVTQQTMHIVDLWFKFFSSCLCRPQWSNSLTGSYFAVSSQRDFFCQFPFSRVLVDELKTTWTVVHQLKRDKPEAAFLQKIKSSPFKQLLADATESKSVDIITRFVHDLTCLLYKAGSDIPGRELAAVRETIVILFEKQREIEQRHYEIPLLELFMLVMKLRKDLELFSEVVAANSGVLLSSQTWLDTQRGKRSFCLHVSAFRSILEHIRNEANGIDKVENCRKWKELVCRLKKVADSVLMHAETELSVTWSLIRFVELFLDQLVPSTTTHTQDYLKTLAPLARRLWKGASTINSLADVKFLNIITKALLGCSREVELKMLCSWRETKCKKCKVEKMIQPVKLPCGHLICYGCVTLDDEGRNCPGCRRSIPDVQALVPAELSKNQTKELAMFKSACTSFFLEYLSTFCFPDPNSASRHGNLPPPDDKILLALEKLVICDKRTQKMSPHLSTFDTNPTARSYILQLLMRCDKEVVKDQLNQHFMNMSEVMEDRGVLMDIYIQCSQDMLVNRSRISNLDDRLNTEFAHNLLQTTKRLITRPHEFQVEQLDICSTLLYVSRVAAESIHLLISGKINNLKEQRDLQMLVDLVCNFCRDKLVMKQYIVKYICRRFGIDSVDLLLRDKMYRANLLPQNLIPQQEDEDPNLYLQYDNFVLSGPTYVRTKDLLFDIVEASNFPPLLQNLINEIQQAPDSVFQIMLALSTWTARGIASDKLRNEAYVFVCRQLHMHLTGSNSQQLYTSVCNRAMDAFVAPNASEQMQYKISDFLTLTQLTLQASADGLVKHLQSVVTNPETLANQFLPTMPASNFFLVKAVMQQDRTYHNQPPKAYKCPNGHVYFIGECTNPNQAGRCPDCGSNIGGQRHGLLHHGNTAGEITEQSQAGYLLKPPGQRGNTTPERAMTKLSVCATRACLHAALLLASRGKEDVVRGLVKVQGGRDQLVEFLMGQIVKDLKQLADCIGKSLDDAIIVMHRILHEMRRTNTQMNDGQCNFLSMAGREKWEEAFQRRFLSLIFRDTDGVLNEARQVILDAGQFAEKPLHRLVYEINQPQDLGEDLVEWKNPALWKYRNHIDLQHLKLRLEAVDETAGGDGVLLKVMLNMEDLGLIQHIGLILQVQSAFIANYRHKVDILEADKLTLEDYLGESDQFFIDELKMYIEIWNTARKRLAKADRYNTMRKYFDRDMDMESPISMCLPSDRRRGCCALVLIEYLVELQNELLNKCRELVLPTPEFQQIDAADVSSKHLVCIDQHRDLLPLILANSQYEATVTGGRTHHSITYNLPLLQRKVEENFILRKCIIRRETIPRMTYPQDVGLGKDCEVMQERFKQIPLPVRLTQAIDSAALTARKADICEAVRYVTLIIQFLAKLVHALLSRNVRWIWMKLLQLVDMVKALGGSEEQTICEYAEKELTLPADETGMIPRSAKITHCFSLYERLSWHRSLISVRIGQNPFELVQTSDDDMPEELEEKVHQALQQLNIEKLQFELNSLMMVGPDLQEDWSVADALFEYVDGKYENLDNNWCYQIPGEVLVKHSRQLFKISMKFMAKPNQHSTFLT